MTILHCLYSDCLTLHILVRFTITFSDAQIWGTIFAEQPATSHYTTSRNDPFQCCRRPKKPWPYEHYKTTLILLTTWKCLRVKLMLFKPPTPQSAQFLNKDTKMKNIHTNVVNWWNTENAYKRNLETRVPCSVMAIETDNQRKADANLDWVINRTNSFPHDSDCTVLGISKIPLVT